MNAPVLSPTERDETTRFGIHDPEAFERIIESFDDVVPCVASDCSAPASTVVVTRCCGFQWFACDTHLAQGLKESRDFLLMLMLRGKSAQCTKCGHSFEFASQFEDVYRVVPL